jgi:THO complex subunit 1 transcription elongation factor
MHAVATYLNLAHASAQGMVDSNGEPVDAAFYRRFWGLQPVFMNPGPAMRPGPWAAVMNDLTAVLDEFDKQKTIAAASSAPDAEGEGSMRECHHPVFPPCWLQVYFRQ